MMIVNRYSRHLAVTNMKKKLSFEHFDAELNTDICDTNINMDLTLTLRIGLEWLSNDGSDMEDGSGTPRKTIPWTPGAWAQWKDNFVKTSESYWSGKFWLLNETGLFAVKKGGQTYIPNAYCKLKIVLQDARLSNNHSTVDVVRLHPSETAFREADYRFSSRVMDLRPVVKNSTGKTIMQRPGLHEVGHLLGMNHVDYGKTHCPTGSPQNERVCYGVADIDLGSIMGAGMQLREANARPWQIAMQKFAITQGQTGQPPVPGLFTDALAGLKLWDAKMARVYPRTVQEVQSRTIRLAPAA